MRNILFNAEMTKAILDGRKTQTRRVVGGGFLDEDEAFAITHLFKAKRYKEAKDSFGFEAPMKAGQTIWVREPAKVIYYDDLKMTMQYQYSANDESGSICIPDRFIKMSHCATNICPKWIENCQGIPNGCIKEMARIFLKVTNVRVERLQDITKYDIQKEGAINQVNLIDTFALDYEKESENYKRWITIWNSTAPKGYKWEYNPYVFVYEFERVEK